MKFHKAALLVVGSGLVAGAAAIYSMDRTYEVGVRIEAGDVYTARNLGTLFEAEGNNTVCRAGFPAGAQTRAKISQKHLEFTCGPREAVGGEFELVDTGRPNADSYRPEVRSLRDEVIDVAAGAILQKGQWHPFSFEDVNKVFNQSAISVQSVQIIAGEELAFPHGVGSVVHKDRTILDHSGSLRNGIYYDGRLYVAHFDGNTMGSGITYCSWKAPEEKCSDVRELPWPYWQDIYGMLGWRGAIYMSTGADEAGKGAGIWRLDPESGSLTRLFPVSEEMPGEFYGMALVGDTLIAGHYPTGYLAVVEVDGTARFVEEPKIRDDTYGFVDGQPLYREAQSLNLYAGRLWVGMFPWGFLWEADPTLTHWERHRLFTWPEVSVEEPAPFNRELRRRYLAMTPEERAADMKFTQPSLWGQRIHSVALSGDENAVLYGLGNMPGLPYDAVRDADFGAPEDFSDYGTVRGVRAPNTIIKYIPWPEEGTLDLTFRISKGRMSLLYEGRTVQRIDALIDEQDLRGMHVVSVGSGLYGASEYEVEVDD